MGRGRTRDGPADGKADQEYQAHQEIGKKGGRVWIEMKLRHNRRRGKGEEQADRHNAGGSSQSRTAAHLRLSAGEPCDADDINSNDQRQMSTPRPAKVGCER